MVYALHRLIVRTKGDWEFFAVITILRDLVASKAFRFSGLKALENDILTTYGN